MTSYAERYRSFCGRHRVIAVLFPDIAILAILPILLINLDDSWSFLIPEGTIDPYIYNSFFLDLQKNVHAFGELYYASRVPWIVLGNAAYSLGGSPANGEIILGCFWPIPV